MSLYVVMEVHVLKECGYEVLWIQVEALFANGHKRE